MKQAATTTAAMLISLLFLAPVMVLMVPLWLLVRLCGLIEEAFFKRSVSDWSQIIQYDPVVGWKPRPGLRNTRYPDPVGDVGTISTDESGWPLSLGIEASDVIVFGDSFAFGFGSKLRDAYFSIDPSIRIKPVAAPSYNMVQELMLMKQHRGLLNGKIVFWFVCLENDLVENLKPYNSRNYANPFVSRTGEGGEWRIHDEHLEPKRWPYRQDSDNTQCFAEICAGSPYAERVRSSLHFLIGKAKQVCDSTGSELVVLTIPDKRQLTPAGIKQLKARLHDSSGFDENRPDDIVAGVCRSLGVSVTPGKEHLSINDYKPRDPHWNRNGHRRVSRIVAEYYRTRYPGTAAAPARHDSAAAVPALASSARRVRDMP